MGLGLVHDRADFSVIFSEKSASSSSLLFRPPKAGTCRAAGVTGANRGPRWVAPGGLAQAAGDFGGPVGEDDVGARAADGGERLVDDPVAVDPALGRRRLDHRVLAADLVGGHR